MPAGVPGAKAIRLLEVPGLTRGRPGSGTPARHWLVVSTVAERQWSDAAVQAGLQDMEWVGSRALAHEAVVERFLHHDAVLPMQLFALFRTDARAIDHVVQRRRSVAKILSRIEHQVEWGLRLTFEPAKETRLDGARATGGSAAAVSGREYLKRKRASRDESRTQLRRARGEAARVYRALSPAATRSLRRTDLERAVAGSRLVLDAAFLVPAARSRTFASAVRRHTRPLARSGVSVSLTGPWPAYNFI